MWEIAHAVRGNIDYMKSSATRDHVFRLKRQFHPGYDVISMGNGRCSFKAGVHPHVRHSEEAYAPEAVDYDLGVLEELYLGCDMQHKDDLNRDMQQALGSCNSAIRTSLVQGCARVFTDTCNAGKTEDVIKSSRSLIDALVRCRFRQFRFLYIGTKEK